MPNDDYVVRTWQVTPAGHARVTVVDMHGRIAHLTVTRDHVLHGDIDRLLRDRLAALPPFTVYRNVR